MTSITLEGRIVGVRVADHKVEYAFRTEQIVDAEGCGDFVHELMKKKNEDKNKLFPLIRFASPFAAECNSVSIGYTLIERKELVRIHVGGDFRKRIADESKNNIKIGGDIDSFVIGTFNQNQNGFVVTGTPAGAKK